jgi:Ser/Thr protein kinase RdoA (MazF antagonist)
MNTFAGMQLFPVSYSTLSASALLQFAITTYNLDKASEIVYLKRGFNDTYLLTTITHKFILRVYKHLWRSLEDIESELELLILLKKNGVSVSVPLPDINKKYIQSISAAEGVRYAVLFSFAEGEAVKKLAADQAFLLGVQCGKIHLLTQDLNLAFTAQDYDITKQFRHTIKVLEPILVHHTREFNFLLELQQCFLQAIEKMDKAEVRQGICHGDLQAENFYITKDNQFTFFDFDFFGRGFLVYDLAVFMWYDHKNKPPEIMNGFFKGYESQCNISAAEYELIPWLSTLRAVFQMTMYCELSNGKELPLWPAQQIADFVNKVEKWSKEKIKLPSR